MMLILAILGSLLVAATADKIVGGTAATPGQFPFIVHLDSMTVEAYCDGSILSEYWILSAAHCHQKGQDSAYNVVAGDHSLSGVDGYEQTIAMAEQIMHPDYNSRTLANDIMLIKLSAPLTFNAYVSPITLPDMTPDRETLCDIAGWGNTLSSGTNWPDLLQYVTLPVIATPVCNAPNAYNGQVLPGMICVGTMEGGQDSCQGDSGGPVTLANQLTQVGIVSWGYGCAEPNHPGVYTDVHYYNEWITTTMASN